MIRLAVVFTLALGLIHTPPAVAADPAPSIMLNADIIARLHAAADNDPETAARLKKLRSNVDAILDQPLLAAPYAPGFKGTVPPMLYTARQMVRRATMLALAWNLWGVEAYAKRGREELLAIAALEDWNPGHFLDTAEMSAAVALGLDWLTAYLSEADKATIVDALVDKGLNPGLSIYEGAATWVNPTPGDVSPAAASERSSRRWPVESFNWNTVSNSGMTLAALAVRPYKPDLADRVLDHARVSIALGFAEYGEDGGFPEGIGYWSYATRYAVTFLAAVESVLDDDFGFAETPGFTRTGDFILHMTGPTGLGFNYGDSATEPNRAALAWLSEAYGRPVDAWFDTQMSPGSRLALDLVWRVSNPGQDPVVADVPTGKLFGSIHVATFRTAWLDPNAVFVGFKGGDSRGHHTHLDLGSFVIDGDGERWAMALGPGNYDLPGYFGDKRWAYYRTGTAGQNTLMFEDANQNPQAMAPLTAFDHRADRSFAIADLGAAYDVPAASIRRGMALLDDRTVLIQDEIGGDKPQAVTWQMHTAADIAVSPDDPSTLILRQNGRTLAARIVEPPDARFATASTHQPPPQLPNTGINKIVIDLAAVSPGTDRRLAVVLAPGAETVPDATAIIPLSQWETRLGQ
ncbi:heparinase II/III domain-containing protein [Bauldia sp.]|uniref:heparinase II/III domain-containing protein n=1 Tax=Bauldia sp. TaxID=2575872 RepID=UPI003BAAE16E